ncbi:hypothetical protein JW921_10700 [Candidatus Fermentibacterales bacterium]|nr:hypothetical protein [Candidatus Fermentibacterales bacterium]
MAATFWTRMGAVAIGHPEWAPAPRHLPREWRLALEEAPRVAGGEPFEHLLGKALDARKARHIYSAAWEQLRPLGFSRSARVYPWPGIPLLLLARRRSLGVVCQSFGERVPAGKRSLALAGKSTALRSELGMELLVVAASLPDEARDLLEMARVSVCTPDMIGKAVLRSGSL